MKVDTTKPMSGAAIDTLVALVECGPLGDGDVPSKVGRNELIYRGLAVHVVSRCEDGYTAATYAGGAAYCALYGAVTMKEAKAVRLVRREAGALP